MSLDAMVGRSKTTTSNFCHLDRSELDDLLDEILGDQLFVSNFTSKGRAEAPGVNGKQRDNAEQQHAGNGMMTQQCNSATDGVTTATSSAPKMEVVNQVPVEFNQGRNDPGRGSVPTPPASGMYEEESMENHVVLPGGRNRTPSLPGNQLALEHRRRLQSVPCNDYYGQMQNSQDYYAAGSGRFVHGMCSEEPITWLDQQKMKLRTRQESKGWIGQAQGHGQAQVQGQVQSPQQKQLMEELKAAQLLCAQKRAELNNTAEQYTEYNNNNYSHLTHEQAPTNESFVHQTYIGNGDLRGAEKSTSSSVSLQSDTSNGENGKDVCKSERSYYVSGIERPPFTTHQTKYVFSVSSPHASGRYPGSTSPTLQLLQKASTTCSPPTPLRGESSREAMKQTTMVHDWDLERWEQGSHTSLSSRSDATERSVVMLPNAGKGMDVRMWNAENHAQHFISTSAAAAAIERDGVWSVGAGAAPLNWSAPNGNLRPPSGAPEPVNWHSPNGDIRVPTGANAPVYWPPNNGNPRPSAPTAPTYYHSSNGDLDLKSSGAPATLNWHVPNGDLRPTGVAMHGPPLAGVPKPVPTTVSSSPAIVGRDSAPAFASSHESSSVSAQGMISTSHGLPPQNYNGHLSENHSEYKSSKAISRPSPTSFGFHPDASFGSSVTSATALLSQNAAPTAVVPTPVASTGKAPNGIASAAAAAPSVVASAAMATNASVSNARSQGPAPPQIPATMTTTMGQQSYSTGNRKEDANINSAQNWQLSSITEQPSAPEITSEVISLRLIGPGMQKLEPDGTLPAVRPVTPKFPHPGMDGSLSFSHQQTTSRISDRRCSEDKPIQPPQTYQGLRRATVAYNQPLTTTSGTRSDVSGGRVEMRPHSVDVLNGEAKPDKKMPIRRSTASSDSQELLPSNGCPDSIPSAYHRTERLLSADFTVQGLGRKTSKGERSRRDARRQSEFDNAGRRPSETYNGARHSRSDFPDGMDDVFATKTGLEVQSGDAGRRRESYARKQKDKEFSLEMLDTALAGLQASANSPSDDSGPSLEVLQSPQSGKTTPGFYTGQGQQQPQSATGTLAKPFGNDPSSSSTSADVSTSLKTSQAPRFVRDSSKYWHKPNIARDEAIDYLKGKPPGTFIIRNSNSFPGAFGLALKVAHLPPHVHSRGVDPKAELVRHFLIEPTLKGVKLKGCSSEPVFGSLAALVYQHSQTPLSLPCKLIIPDSNNLKTLETTTTVKSQATASEVLSQGAACNVLYINSVDMESLTGYEAINKAVAWTFKQSPAPLTTLVHFKVSSQGVTLTDTNRKLFFRRHYPVDTVTFAGMDPEDRNWTWANEETKTSVTAKIFGFVARKQGSPTDNACHIFAELDADQPGSAIVEFIMKVMLGRGRSKQDSI